MQDVFCDALVMVVAGNETLLVQIHVDETSRLYFAGVVPGLQGLDIARIQERDATYL